MTQASFSHAEVQADRRRANAALLGQAAIFAIGVTSVLQVANFAATMVSVVCLVLVPAFLLMTHRGVDLVPLVLAVLGWISYTASCVLGGVSVLWENAVAPGAFALYFVGITVLTGRGVDRVMTLLAGLAGGTVGFFLTQGIKLTNTDNFLDLWKYGVAHPATILVLFALVLARAPLTVHAAVLGVLGLASLGLNFRSHALICLLTASLMFAHRFLGTRVARGWLFFGIIAFGLAFSYVLPVAARAGIFGSALQDKQIEQETTELPTLLAGRTEPPESLTAIMERPLLGWGSALKLPPDFYAAAEHLAVRMGYAPTFPFEGYWRLPADDYSAMHSIVLGSWAEGGLLAVLLPLFLLVACLGIVWRFALFGKWAPLVVLTGFQGVWDLLYSPWLYNAIPEFVCIALLFAATRVRAQPPP